MTVRNISNETKIALAAFVILGGLCIAGRLLPHPPNFAPVAGVALFAGFLHPKIASVTLKNGPLSFHAWTQTPLVDWPVANVPRGALKAFDLPELIRALGKKVTLIQPWGLDLKPLSGRALTQALKATGLSSINRR